MLFHEFLQHVRSQSTVQLPDNWMQGRTVFGGISAAAMLEALLKLVPDGRMPRTLTISFVGPLEPGPVELRTEVYRSGKHVTQAQAWLSQKGEVQGTLLASFGSGRESMLNIGNGPVPVVAEPASAMQLPNVPGITPQFTEHFEYRWLSPYLPMSGKGDGVLSGWMRFREPEPALGFSHVLAMLDAWPVACFSLFQRPAPFSSLSWTLEFLGEIPAESGNDYWLFEDVTDHAVDGYAQTRARLWSPSGQLVALSRQTVSIFG